MTGRKILTTSISKEESVGLNEAYTGTMEKQEEWNEYNISIYEKDYSKDTESSVRKRF